MLTIDDKILSAIRSITRAIDVWSRQLLRDYGLTAPQLAALREVHAGKNVSPVEISKALQLSQPTVTGILKRLEKQGLILCERSKLDRRKMLSKLTVRGRKCAKRAPPLLRDRLRKQLVRIPQSQQSQILAALRQVAAMLRTNRNEQTTFLFLDQD